MIARPRADDVARLAAVHHYPCVTIVLPTRPGRRMALGDAAVLRGLGAEAVERLRIEQHPDTAVIAQRIAAAAQQVAAEPADHGLAVLVAANRSEVFHLTEVLEARVVVDPTFATRDLLATVQQNPPYLLLALRHDGARLFEHDGRGLQEVMTGDFPAPGPPEPAGSVPWQQHRQVIRRSCEQIAAALEPHLRGRRRTLVVMAAERILPEFLEVSAHPERMLTLAREVPDRPNLRALESAARPLLAQRLTEMAAAAEDVLASSTTVVHGLVACWDAASSSAPGLLLVEQSYAEPARLTPHGLVPTPDREHPNVLDDAVDELVELVGARGGQVCFVPDGSLRWADHVALSIAN